MQSGHSLNCMCPPLNLHSLCLCYYLCPHLFIYLFFLLHFLLANYPAFSSVYLCRCSCILLVLSLSLQSTWFQSLSRDGHRPCGLFLHQHSCLGRLPSLHGGGMGLGAPEPSRLSCEGPTLARRAWWALPGQLIPGGPGDTQATFLEQQVRWK